MSAPSQSYKMPESVPGTGQTGLSGQNYNQGPFASGQKQPETLQEEMGITTGNNFNLANTKAEAKGEENTIPNPERGNTELNTAGRGGDTVRQQLQSHEIDLPTHAPHNAVMPNESSKQPGKSSDTGKPK